MSIIEASSGTYRSRVDGTIVLSVEIEPRFRADALALFGMPGTPMALAGLKPASSKPEKAEPQQGGVGYWCWQAIQLCQDEKFREWISAASLGTASALTAEDAAKVIRRLCKITSRNELDTDTEARDRFVSIIQRPYKQWSEAHA